MKIFGLDISRFKQPVKQTLSNVYGAWRRAYDFVTGAWQSDSSPKSADCANPLLNSVTFACIRLLANDVAKLPLCLKRMSNDVWKTVTDSPYWAVLRDPNFWQTRVEFYQGWIISLLHYGNTYVLMDKDARGICKRMTILDPRFVQPLIANETGDIFYRVNMRSNPLAGLFNDQDVYIPAEWIIHHKYLPIEHPLIGCPPLRVAALASTTGNRILAAHNDLFLNGIVPPGVLILPEGATTDQVETLATQWAEFRRSGRTAVLEASTKFEPIAQKSIDSGALELLNFSNIDVCVAFGVPPWKIGIGTMPVGSNAETGNLLYLSQILQGLLEDIEALLDKKLQIPDDLSAEFDVSALTRMDTKSRYEAASLGVKGGWLTPNEARAKADGLEPVEGGDTCYMQQQNFSLAALDARDRAPPVALGGTTSAPNQGNTDPTSPDFQTTGDPKQDETLQAALGARWRGVWRMGATWVAGDMVTRSGSLWTRIKEYDGKPEDVFQAGTDWALTVKRGSIK